LPVTWQTRGMIFESSNLEKGVLYTTGYGNCSTRFGAGSLTEDILLY
jgi:hypothetical protein